MMINSAPSKKAAVNAINAAGWKLARLGRNNITAPNKAIKAASQRCFPTFSPKKGIARIIAKTGFRKLIAVASGSGIKETDANIKVTPAQPAAVREIWILRLGFVNRGRRIDAAIVNVAVQTQNDQN